MWIEIIPSKRSGLIKLKDRYKLKKLSFKRWKKV
jgi:hypothetical protein